MKTMTDPASWAAAARTRAEQRSADGQTFTGVYTANKLADDEIFGNIFQPSGNEAFDNAVQRHFRNAGQRFFDSF